MDEKQLNRLAQMLYDSANRGLVAGVVGMPADGGNALMSLLGYGQKKPFMGSEWIGDRMEDAGIVSKNRYPLAELLLLSAASPLGMSKKTPPQPLIR